MLETSSRYPCVIYSHTTSWHDGGVALLLTDGSIRALAAERVGDRYKHSWNSRLAYNYLKDFYEGQACCAFGSSTDYFVDTVNGIERNGHHSYHAAGAFYASPFDDAVILVVDGQGPEAGKLASTSIWKGEGHKLTLVEMPSLTEGVFVPNSIGHFYTAVGALAGMKNLFEEGKTMGLAAYGEPSTYVDYFRRYVHSNSDGSYFIDPRFTLAVLGNTLGPKIFRWQPQPSDVQEIWGELTKLRKTPLREDGEDVTQEDMNIAYAGQLLLEELILGLARRARSLTGSDYLCIGGGVALNAVANGKVLQSGMFKDIFIFPAPADDGQAIGKLFSHIQTHGIDVNTKAETAFYGPPYPAGVIQEAITKYQDQVRVITSEMDSVTKEVVDRIVDGQVIGWFQGGSELGPRALGHRSILADPRNPGMRDFINGRVKRREWYRPLAPLVLEDEAGDYFDLDRPSPFMLIITNVKPEKRALIPAVTHADGSARIQTVNRQQNPEMYNLIQHFKSRTGVPILLNTSFNRNSEPIVESPQDALEAFINMEMDALVLEDCLLIKKEDAGNSEEP
jgi:carbamoyltransferase